nr:Casein kinase 1-like protein HD16 [Ipomoea batatas]
MLQVQVGCSPVYKIERKLGKGGFGQGALCGYLNFLSFRVQSISCSKACRCSGSAQTGHFEKRKRLNFSKFVTLQYLSLLFIQPNRITFNLTPEIVLQGIQAEGCMNTYHQCHTLQTPQLFESLKIQNTTRKSYDPQFSSRVTNDIHRLCCFIFFI